MKLILSLIGQQMQKYRWLYVLMICLVLGTATLWIAEPLYASFAINTMLGVRTGMAVDYVWLFGMWGVLFVLISTVQTAQRFVGWKLSELMVLDYRERVYDHVLRLGISFHTKQKSGEVVKILDSAADTMADLQREVLAQLIPSFLSATVFLIIGFAINTTLATVLIISIVCYLGIALIGTRRTMKLQQDANKLWVESIGRAYDAVTNIYSVKSGAQEAREHSVMHGIHEKTYAKQRQVNRKWAMVEAINFFMLTRILLVAIGIYLFTQDVLTLGEVYFFQSSFFRVLTPFEMLGAMLPQWNKQVGRVKLAEEIMSTPMDVQNAAQPVILRDLEGEIRFENVHFSYTPVKQLKDPEEEAPKTQEQTIAQEPEEEEALAPRDPNVIMESGETTIETVTTAPDANEVHAGKVLRDIDLAIRPGEHIAFVGHSGAGKTTLAMLINRFYDVTEGRIMIDDVDIRDLDMQWWRSQIGLVLQENIMFNDSILENIRYGRPDATLEEVREAAQRAAADEFIEALPEKYNTLIGDRGIRLSGGQRQRVAIARAILKKPKIVVLDEATSALDSVTERRVQEGIKNLIQGRTACIIAHRLSTVRSVDRIAVFHEGKLIDVGPHEELMKRCDIYKEMVELQSQGMLAEE